ncbi:transposase, MuDR, plant [Tanacetum coccineum]
MNGIDQWPSSEYQKPLPPIKRRMHGRPPHKRKRDVTEDDGNRTMISRKGQLNHCTLCKKPGHNQRACPSKPEVIAAGEIMTASVRKVTAAGEIVTVSGGNVTASGDLVSAKGGNVTARGGKVYVRGVTARRGKVSTRGGKVSTKGGKVTSTPSTPSTPPLGFEMSTPDTASNTGSSSINKLRTVNGKVVSSRGRGDGSKSIIMGLPRHAWPKEEEPRQEEPRQQQQIRKQQQRQQQQGNQEPRQQPRRTSERIAQIMFNKPLTPGPGLDPDDAISLE